MMAAPGVFDLELHDTVTTTHEDEGSSDEFYVADEFQVWYGLKFPSLFTDGTLSF